MRLLFECISGEDGVFIQSVRTHVNRVFRVAPDKRFLNVFARVFLDESPQPRLVMKKEDWKKSASAQMMPSLSLLSCARAAVPWEVAAWLISDRADPAQILVFLSRRESGVSNGIKIDFFH